MYIIKNNGECQIIFFPLMDLNFFLPRMDTNKHEFYFLSQNN